MNSDTLEYYRYNGSTSLASSQLPPMGDLEKRLQHFYQGDTRVLDTPGLVNVIAQYIFDLYHKGDMGNALILLENLGEAALSDIVEHREKSLITLSIIAEKILNEENEDLIEAVSMLLIRWLKKETEFISGYEIICLQLSSLVQKMLDLGLWYQCEDMIIALHDIRNGKIKKNRVLTQVISKVQSRIAESRFLDRLMKTYVDDQSDKCDVAGTLLIHLGDRSVPFLLQALELCEKKSQRYRLINLISAAGEKAIPQLVSNLQNSPPWYLTRNIIFMMSQIDDASLFPHIQPLMAHDDERVQKAVVECFRRMGNDSRVNGLLEAINLCNDGLKPQIIRILGPSKETRVGNAFIALLKEHSTFPQDIGNDIIREVCQHLHHYPTEKVTQTLEELLASPQTGTNLPPETVTDIERAYRKLQAEGGGVTEWQSGTMITPEDERKSKGAALIETSSPLTEKGNNSFSSSRQWLDLLQQQHEALPHLTKHIQRRNDFYSQLKHDEFLAFSTLLTHRKYNAGEVLVAHGDVQSSLFFIEEGRVAVAFPNDDTTLVIRDLEMGDIFGHGVFMNGSEWTVTLKAIEDTEVFLFDQEQLLHLQPSFPELCNTILHYGKVNDVIMKLLDTVIRCSNPLSRSNPIPFTGYKDGHLPDITILGLFHSSFCFTFSLPDGIDYSLFMDKELYVTLESDSAPSLRVRAHTLGIRYQEKKERSLCIMARFLQEFDHSEFRCTSVSL